MIISTTLIKDCAPHYLVSGHCCWVAINHLYVSQVWCQHYSLRYVV